MALVTIARGAIVWENGTLHTRNGHGKFVPRPCFGAAFEGVNARDEERELSKQKVNRAKL